VIEFARNVCGIADANSTEMDPETTEPVIDKMEEQKKISQMGGTMRLGAYACKLKRGSKAAQAYGATEISERHRHRWEVNNKYLQQLEENGLVATGVNPESGLVEIVENKEHPYFVGVQYHPELKSTVDNPHPLFVRFIKAAIEDKKRREGVSATRGSLPVYS
jgi:CTP synthase